MKKDIKTSFDIKLLVDSFYSKVRNDEKLGPIFSEFIKDWPRHLEKMYSFWHTILLHEHKYKGTPFQPHIKLPITSDHFSRWVHLFEKTTNEHFQGETADEAKSRAQTMAKIFMHKLKYINNQTEQSI